jgi:hypothetical protein
MVVGKEWHLVNNGTANVTFTGASGGNANALVLYPGNGAVLNSPFSGYVNVVSTYQTPITSGTQYSPTYYSSSSSLAGVTPFTGLPWYSSSAAPAVATAAQVGSYLQSLSNCNTSNQYVFNPYTNTCVLLNSGSSGVTSLTGDGVSTSNTGGGSGATGVVTLIPATAAANTFVAGPSSGSSAALTQRLLSPADLANVNSWKLAGPIANTGSTSAVQVGSITIPAGVMGATGHLDIRVELDSCTTTSGLPAAACTGTANTGTCTYSVHFGTSNTGGTAILSGPATTAAKNGTLAGFIENTSTSAQLGKLTEISGSTVYSGATGSSAISTTGATYLNFYVQNSVSGDNCFIDEASVRLFM